jgi:hypothetical protein
MGRRKKTRNIETTDLCVSLLGFAEFLGFLAAARINGANASPFDALAFG